MLQDGFLNIFMFSWDARQIVDFSKLKHIEMQIEIERSRSNSAENSKLWANKQWSTKVKQVMQLDEM